MSEIITLAQADAVEINPGRSPNLLRRMQHEVYPHIVIGKDNLAFLGFLQDTGFQQRLYLAMDGLGGGRDIVDLLTNSLSSA